MNSVTPTFVLYFAMKVYCGSGLRVDVLIEICEPRTTTVERPRYLMACIAQVHIIIRIWRLV